MTTTTEKTKQQLLDEFNAWYDEREREEERGGRPLTREEMGEKLEEMDIVTEFVSQEVHAMRDEMRAEEELLSVVAAWARGEHVECTPEHARLADEARKKIAASGLTEDDVPAIIAGVRAEVRTEEEALAQWRRQ